MTLEKEHSDSEKNTVIPKKVKLLTAERMRQINMILDVDIRMDLKKFSLASAFSLSNGSYGILGASGCGKSMTLKSIAGIVTPDSGSITVRNGDSERILFDKKRKINVKPQKRNVGYLFQNYALFPNMTVEQNILIGVSEKKEEVLQQMLELFHLEGMEKRYPKTLSGGQQQRVALARILAYNPDILLLDEPFSAMDTFLREGLRLEMLELLKGYRGVSVMVSHDRDEVYQLCDNIILMDNGHIIQVGSKREVFETPRTVKAARLTGCKNITRIEPVGEHSFRAVDWGGIILKAAGKITENVKYAGIRAHDFEELASLSSRENEIETALPEVSEMPFEWYVTLANGIWWKKEKNRQESRQDGSSTFSVPAGLYVPPEKIMLLEED